MDPELAAILKRLESDNQNLNVASALDVSQILTQMHNADNALSSIESRTNALLAKLDQLLADDNLPDGDFPDDALESSLGTDVGSALVDIDESASGLPLDEATLEALANTVDQMTMSLFALEAAKTPFPQSNQEVESLVQDNVDSSALQAKLLSPAAESDLLQASSSSVSATSKPQQ